MRDEQQRLFNRHQKTGHHYTFDLTLRDYACDCRVALALAPLQPLDRVDWISEQDRDRGEARRKVA